MSVKEISPNLYRIDCRPDGYKGKRERLDFTGTLEEALIWERVIMRRHVATPAVQPRSLAAIFPVWLVWYRANRAKTTVEAVELIWDKHLKETFAKLQPKYLTRGIIEQYKTKRTREGVKPSTVNKELAFFGGMIRWAVDNDICDQLPFSITGFSRKMTAAPKPRPLTPEQITKIYELIAPHHKLSFLLMADAGMRRNEALTLTREQVEFENGIIFVTGKGNKERIVPITTDRLMAELTAKKHVKGWLTVNPKTNQPYLNIRNELERVAKRAGLEKHLYHHLLRHSFGTNATAAHLDLSSLQSIMGHSSPSTTGIYQHLAAEYLHAQGRKLNDLVKNECPHGQDGHDQQNYSGE